MILYFTETLCRLSKENAKRSFNTAPVKKEVLNSQRALVPLEIFGLTKLLVAVERPEPEDMATFLLIPISISIYDTHHSIRDMSFPI